MEASSLVICVGCPDLHGPLSRMDMEVLPVEDETALRRLGDDVAPRAVVIGGPASARIDWMVMLARLRRVWPLVDVLSWSPRGTPSLVRRALRAGARDVVLTTSAERAARRVDAVIDEQQLLPRASSEAAPDAVAGFEGMLARSRSMFDLFETAAQVAQSNAAVLILGETGTGKELLARAIHRRSRRDGRFVAVNCGAVPETLIDSELFGHLEGAFTGAIQAKPGLFRHADGGTLLLDEAGNVPLPVQYRLLRVLQEGAVRPVGADTEEPVDVRVIAATSASLEDDVRAGRFREDLFYRLDVIRLVIPPLRERPDDIIYLFTHFARRFADEYRLRRPDVTDGFLDALTSHAWPGNVRQLENFTERLVLTEGNTTVTGPRFHQLVAFNESTAPVQVSVPQSRATTQVAIDQPMEAALRPHFDDLERAYLEGMLEHTRGRVGKAATEAGISRRTLTRMMKRLGIDKADFR